MDCGICCEKLNKSTRKKISCPYCEYACCLTCFKQYLLDLSEDANCMNCRKTLSLDFIAQVTPKVFHNQEYRKKRTNNAIELEKSLIPHSQTLVENEIKKRKANEKIKILEEEKRLLMLRLREIRNEIWMLKLPHLQGVEETKEEEKTKFIKKCENGDCRGFLSSSWKCGICETYTCSKCFALKGERNDENHVCKEEDVATARLISQETKPCPKCAVPISKIDGCDQMWCVSCHTPFSWNKGIIEKGNIHNPHFFQWQRQQNGGEAPRVPGDIPHCLNNNGLPTFQRILNKSSRIGVSIISIESRYRIVNHIQQVTMGEYPLRDINDNSDLRIKYLLNEIDEEKWKYNIQLRDKRREKNIAIRQVLEMFTNSLIDYWNQFIISDINILTITDQLRDYVNQQFQVIKKQYDNQVPFIDENWNIITRKIKERMERQPRRN